LASNERIEKFEEVEKELLKTKKEKREEFLRLLRSEIKSLQEQQGITKDRLKQYVNEAIAFFNHLETLCFLAVETTIYNSDLGIFLVGERGTGKSTRAFSESYYIEQRLKELGVKAQVFVIDNPKSIIGLFEYFGKEKNLHMFKQEYEKPIFIFDELHAYASKRQAMSVLNIYLVKLMKLIRPINSVYFFVSQEVGDIDLDLRSVDFIHFLEAGIERGRFFVYTKFKDVQFHGSAHVHKILKNFDFFADLIMLVISFISSTASEFMLSN